MSDPRFLPHWVIELVAEVAYYEDVHAKAEECLHVALAKVPAEVRSFASGWRSAASKERSEVEQEVRDAICREEGHSEIVSAQPGLFGRCVRCYAPRSEPSEVPE